MTGLAAVVSHCDAPAALGTIRLRYDHQPSTRPARWVGGRAGGFVRLRCVRAASCRRRAGGPLQAGRCSGLHDGRPPAGGGKTLIHDRRYGCKAAAPPAPATELAGQRQRDPCERGDGSVPCRSRAGVGATSCEPEQAAGAKRLAPNNTVRPSSVATQCLRRASVRLSDDETKTRLSPKAAQTIFIGRRDVRERRRYFVEQGCPRQRADRLFMIRRPHAVKHTSMVTYMYDVRSQRRHSAQRRLMSVNRTGSAGAVISDMTHLTATAPHVCHGRLRKHRSLVDAELSLR